MRKKTTGFTLIELLAVIVILAIIAVIATPLTINVINQTKEKAFINSTYGLIDEVKLLSWEQMIRDQTIEVAVHFKNGDQNNTDFKISGDMPNSGTIYLNPEGKIELKVWSEELGKCAEKAVTESEVKLTETPKKNCKIKVCPKILLGKQMSDDEIACEDPDSNQRYIGTNPNNYVTFNNELWRIIGVFNGQAKIIRSDYYNTGIAWDEDDGNHSNNWYNSSLNLIFNDTKTGYISTIQSNDPVSYSFIDLTHVWNMGGYDTRYRTLGTRSVFYEAERGDLKSSKMDNHLWEGAIGLMYPSDYGYATSGAIEICDSTVMYSWLPSRNKTAYEECAGNSWLYDIDQSQWTLTPQVGGSKNMFYVRDTGYVLYVNVSTTTIAPRPVLFLNSNVKIIGGKGTDQEPYQLGV